MEGGFFVSVAALGIEALVFIATVICIMFQAIRGGSACTRRLWRPVGISALGGAVAFPLSVHYVVNNPHDQSWATFVVLSILLPSILAVVVGGTLRHQAKK